MDKLEIARRQLGTALALFLDDLDPVSVHCLACGGGEVAETLTQRAGEEPFADHALGVVPDLTRRSLREMRNRYWNAFKHAVDHGGMDRQDEETIANFNDEKNDHVLFVGWYDLMLAAGKMPIEAQAFQAWYFAKFPEKLSEDSDLAPFLEAFPDLNSLSRMDQKARLREMIARSRDIVEVMEDERTDRQPLIMP
jgi:hypothetical protein